MMTTMQLMIMKDKHTEEIMKMMENDENADNDEQCFTEKGKSEL